jgi:predicted nucleic acid-binding protein
VADTYCIDTSALIAAWYERYKPNRFPKLWEQFDQLVKAERLFSSLMVLDECSRRSPELHAWLKEREDMFLPPDEAIQKRVDHIVNTYSRLVEQGKEKFAADPFVIATAEVKGYVVVTEETGPDSLRKIPGVCRALKVSCKNLMELFDAEDWVIG